MAETLGSLCDKLAIVKLKQLHATEEAMKLSLAAQERQLTDEISEYVAAAVRGDIPLERLTFAANKIYKKQDNDVPEVAGNIGEVLARLVDVTARIWKVQEKIYDFGNVSSGEKNEVVKQQRVLNLERNRCMDAINDNLKKLVESRSPKGA